MKTKAKRKYTKRAVVPANQGTVQGCYSAPPPWKIHKSKEDCWRAGYAEGIRSGRGESKVKIDELEERLKSSRGDAITETIKNTANFQEAVTRLVMAAEKQF